MSWAIWIAGLRDSDRFAIARAAAARLRALGAPVTVLALDEIRGSIMPTPRSTDGEQDLAYRALSYMAALLTEAGVPVIIDATAHRRAWRDLARAAIPRFGEVQVVGPLPPGQEAARTPAPGHALPDLCRRRRERWDSLPREAPSAADLVIDTSAETVAEGAERLVRLARDLARRAGALPRPPAVGRTGPGWAIWITGRPGSGKSTVATRLVEALASRGVQARVLEQRAVRRRLLGDGPTAEAEEDTLHRVLAYAAKLLTDAGVCVILDATGPRRMWREAARRLIPRFAEVQLLCPVEVCLERERAVRLGLAPAVTAPGRDLARGPEIAMDYEESLCPDLTLRTDLHDVWSTVEQALRLVARLMRAGPARVDRPARTAS